MRIPLTKVYRAFRELDSFTDEQCLRYVDRARQKRRSSHALVAILTMLISIAAFVATIVGDRLVDAWLAQTPSRVWILRHGVDIVLDIVEKTIPFFAAALIVLMARDVWLRWAVRKELNRTTCPRCEYQLLGLPAPNGLVLCPECGVRTRLDLLGLRPEDLAMPDHLSDAHPPLAS